MNYQKNRIHSKIDCMTLTNTHFILLISIFNKKQLTVITGINVNIIKLLVSWIHVDNLRGIYKVKVKNESDATSSIDEICPKPTSMEFDN